MITFEQGENMFDQEKLEEIREHLRKEFDVREITDEDDPDRNTHTFKFNISDRIYLLSFAKEFINDYDVDAIPMILAGISLKNFFEDEKVKKVVFREPGEIITVEFD
jgi:hypothetical protein